MLELYRYLQPWEITGQGHLVTLLERFDSADPFLRDKDSVIKFCDEYVEDLHNNSFTCMQSYVLYEDNWILKRYRSRSIKCTVSWVYPQSYNIIQVDDKCYLNREHHMIQFRETGDLYIYQSIQDDRSSYLLHRLGCMQDKVIIKL